MTVDKGVTSRAGLKAEGAMFDKRNTRFAIARFKCDGSFGAIRFKEPEAGQIRHVKERSQKFATDAVRFFSGGGRRAYGNVVSISLLP